MLRQNIYNIHRTCVTLLQRKRISLDGEGYVYLKLNLFKSQEGENKGPGCWFQKREVLEMKELLYILLFY